ncbi:glycosyltransferase [Sphingobium sp. CR2-8]|uniref:glycosyltransferase n=1 Tax=Sphingobium sp. CR2-8 TaxID=1306534 RepID=UPI002DB80203|nr:glycosyltransferase [Sphingobium sp. CR2-8]MEC3909146.1 glycosyltransferase [Sphingobium sp. CR2-8]
MADPRPRRRALCVRPQVNADAAPFLRAISDEWVHALALHCDVSTIEGDFDFEEVCGRVRPDFVIYDAVHWVRPIRTRVKNALAYPHIPRAFFFNCDPHDPARPHILRALADYGADTVFCGIEHLQQMPELARYDCFVIPLFIDDTVFRDHQLEKTIPVSIFGGHLYPSFYPWRAKITEEMPHHIPTLIYPHPGYAAGTVNPFEARDEKYARLLSASHYAIADTTRLDYVVRKHLEIPAAGAVLVAPDSETVKALGFVDMENCLLGEGPDLYQRMKDVSADPAHYERIRKAGHDLVHGRYTRAHWTHILDWFECRATCAADEVPQQTERFGRFRKVSAAGCGSSIADLTIPHTPMSAILEDATVAILTDGDRSGAQRRLAQSLEWIGHIAEPRFLSGVIAMLDGDLDEAARLISWRAGVEVGGTPAAPLYSFGLMDPCELAWMLLICGIRNDQPMCAALLELVPETPHVAVRRALWLLSGSPHDVHFGEEGLMEARSGDWPSIHWLGQESFPDWLRLTARMLHANGQEGPAGHLSAIAGAFDEEQPDEAMGHVA